MPARKSSDQCIKAGGCVSHNSLSAQQHNKRRKKEGKERRKERTRASFNPSNSQTKPSFKRTRRLNTREGRHSPLQGQSNHRLHRRALAFQRNQKYSASVQHKSKDKKVKKTWYHLKISWVPIPELLWTPHRTKKNTSTFRNKLL